MHIMFSTKSMVGMSCVAMIDGLILVLERECLLHPYDHYPFLSDTLHFFGLFDLPINHMYFQLLLITIPFLQIFLLRMVFTTLINQVFFQFLLTAIPSLHESAVEGLFVENFLFTTGTHVCYSVIRIYVPIKRRFL